MSQYNLPQYDPVKLASVQRLLTARLTSFKPAVVAESRALVGTYMLQNSMNIVGGAVSTSLRALADCADPSPGGPVLDYIAFKAFHSVSDFCSMQFYIFSCNFIYSHQLFSSIGSRSSR